MKAPDLPKFHQGRRVPPPPDPPLTTGAWVVWEDKTGEIIGRARNGDWVIELIPDGEIIRHEDMFIGDWSEVEWGV